MDGLWSRLPDELVERMLPYLPVPDLCRFRSVCKRWNSLIGTPEFGSLCVQNASKVASRGASLVFKIYAYNPCTGHSTEIQSWNIYDLNSRRWYYVNNELPKGYDHYGCRTMDAGLVCTFVDAFTDEQRLTSTICNMNLTPQPQVLIIYNLLGGTTKVLPNPPLVDTELMFVNLELVVDNKVNTYKVFLICMDGFYRPRDTCMCVYESSTNQWRIAPTPPKTNPTHLFGLDVRSAWYQGLLYVLLPFSNNLLGQLDSYNFLEDTWEDTGVQFCQGKINYGLDICDLVVSDNRLFLMTQRLFDCTTREYPIMKEPGQLAWPLDINEILLADKAVKTVVRLTPGEAYQKFCIEPDMRCNSKYSLIQAFGYGRSILLMCQQTGRLIEYNLVTGLWETLPSNLVELLVHLPSIPHFSPRHVLGFANLMNSFLRLPSTPWG